MENNQTSPKFVHRVKISEKNSIIINTIIIKYQQGFVIGAQTQ